LQAIEKWMAQHDGNKPKTFAEKNEFKVFLKSMALDFSKEVNFTEATSNAYQVFQSSELPYNVQDIFDAPQIDDA